jgi:hypothetical protein
MDVWNLLSVGASTLVMIVLIHVACYYAVKTMYPPTPVQVPVQVPAPAPTVRFAEPPAAPPVAPEIPLVTTKLPPPVDTRDPGPARSSQPAFSEAAKENEVKVPSNVPTYESLLSAVSSGKEGGGNLGPLSGASV